MHYLILSIGLMIYTPLLFLALGLKTEPINEGDKKINLNFARNFPLKKELLESHLFMRTEVFGLRPLPHKVLQLDDGWMIAGDDFKLSLSSSLNLQRFTSKQLQKIRQVLKENKRIAESNNSKYYLAIAPNKLQVYPELLGIEPYKTVSKQEQIKSICSTLEIPYIDLGRDLADYKSQYRLYHKTDTHWNLVAGFISHWAVLDQVERDFPNTKFNRYDFSDVKIDSLWQPVGDLEDMLMRPKREMVLRALLDPPADFSVSQYNLSEELRKERYSRTASTISQSEVNNLKLMAVHDSFYPFVEPIIRANFGTTISLWDYELKQQLIQKEKPDIILHQVVIREFDRILE